MPCVPWHSLQVGALGSFLAERRPCTLSTYCRPPSAWHDEQSTFCLIVSQGRRWDAVTSEWHWLQDTLACLEPARWLVSTKSDRLSLPAWSARLEWQRMQSAS